VLVLSFMCRFLLLHLLVLIPLYAQWAGDSASLNMVTQGLQQVYERALAAKSEELAAASVHCSAALREERGACEVRLLRELVRAPRRCP
jgi:hypothetical protein